MVDAVRLGMTDDDEIAVERMKHGVMMSPIIPNNAELRPTVQALGNFGEMAAGEEDAIFVGCFLGRHHPAESLGAAGIRTGGIFTLGAIDSIDADEMGPVFARDFRSIVTESGTGGTVIEEHSDIFPSGEHKGNLRLRLFR